ncbi:hypothetical protein [Haloglycomyces albus]|uniref:hypothetical protein n=1 Tax=Haloglycomyces albus TaxID=526067 RepID=UPI00046CD9B1|nr:hypothetical protein [Haloglycomyces albus]
MTDNNEGTVVDLSEAPRQQQFGVNQDGGIINDPLGNAKSAVVGNVPVIAQATNIAEDIENNTGAVNRLFDGEATMDDLLAIGQMIVDISRQILDLVDAVQANIDGPDIGFIAGAAIKAGLDWIWDSLQPIQDLVGMVTGNPERLETTSDMWTQVAQSTEKLAQAYSDEANNNIVPNWEGDAFDAAIVRSNEFLQAINVATTSANHLSDLVALFADFAGRLQDRAKQTLAEVAGAVIGAAEDIAKYGWVAVVPVGIDLAILLTRLFLDLLGIVMQAARIFLSGSQLCSQLEESFESTSEILDFLSNVPHTVEDGIEVKPLPNSPGTSPGTGNGPVQV